MGNAASQARQLAQRVRGLGIGEALKLMPVTSGREREKKRLISTSWGKVQFKMSRTGLFFSSRRTWAASHELVRADIPAERTYWSTRRWAGRTGAEAPAHPPREWWRLAGRPGEPAARVDGSAGAPPRRAWTISRTLLRPLRTLPIYNRGGGGGKRGGGRGIKRAD